MPYEHASGTSVIGMSGPLNASITVEAFSKKRKENMIQLTEAALVLFNPTLTRSLEGPRKD